MYKTNSFKSIIICFFNYGISIREINFSINIEIVKLLSTIRKRKRKKKEELNYTPIFLFFILKKKEFKLQITPVFYFLHPFSHDQFMRSSEYNCLLSFLNYVSVSTFYTHFLVLKFTGFNEILMIVSYLHLRCNFFQVFVFKSLGLRVRERNTGTFLSCSCFWSNLSGIFRVIVSIIIVFVWSGILGLGVMNLGFHAKTEVNFVKNG